MRVFPVAILSLTLIATTAHSEKRCIEEVGGVCLKYEETIAGPKKKKPQTLPPAARAERNLGLSAADRRSVQSALRSMGLYQGAIDGLFGPGTRRAIGAWQQANAARANGFLTAPQVEALVAAGVGQDGAGASQNAAATDSGAPLASIGAVVTKRQKGTNDSTITISVERTDDRNAVLSLKITSPDIKDDDFNDSCQIPVSGKFSCRMRDRVRESNRSRWSPREVVGALPEINIYSQGSASFGGFKMQMW